MDIQNEEKPEFNYVIARRLKSFDDENWEYLSLDSWKIRWRYKENQATGFLTFKQASLVLLSIADEVDESNMGEWDSYRIICLR